MLTRIKSLLIALGNQHGRTRRDAVLLNILLIVWVGGLVLVPHNVPGIWLAVVAASPALSLTGYVGGMLFPQWRRNWLTRAGAGVALLVTLRVGWLVTPPITALLMWYPLWLAYVMTRYHEWISFYRWSSPRGVQAGADFPDFTLPDSAGTPRSLSSFLDHGPILFIFYRGDW